jgi:hypothetical protein
VRLVSGIGISTDLLSGELWVAGYLELFEYLGVHLIWFCASWTSFLINKLSKTGKYLINGEIVI